jgi:phosphoenolpyruvate carboxykinase (ATP)
VHLETAMKQIGTFNPAFGIEKFGFKNLGTVAYNLEAPMLYEESIRRNEAVIVPGGAINAETGIHTGRSPKDKHTVRDANTENVIWWENNNSITPEQFDNLLADFIFGVLQFRW